MKYLPSQFAVFLTHRASQRNIMSLLRFLGALAGMFVLYSVIFHFLMAYEGQSHSWLTGFYWTLTTMSTLGYGDIAFTSDLGRAFAMLVMSSGIVFLLIMLPFTFIRFFYAPWLEAQHAARAPHQLPEETRGHVLLTSNDPVSSALIRRLVAAGTDYALIVPELKDALELHDLGLRVVVGDLDDPETYERVRAPAAAMLMTAQGDPLNTNITFTARGVAPSLTIVATANSAAAVDILHRAGASHALRLSELMGQALARCTVGGDAVTHVVAEVDDVLIAEASAARTPLVGKSLRENHLSELGVSVVGVWNRGRFELARPDLMIEDSAILVLAASRSQLDVYDEHFAIYNVSGDPAMIIGGGRVGRSTAGALRERGIECRVVEKEAGRVHDGERAIVGDAAQLDVLERAGIRKAPAVIITTHDDSLNIYLTIYCRRLREDIQIISRCTHERNVATLHRAGADHVLSYAHMGASTIFNLLKRSRIQTIAEGLDIFRIAVPGALEGRTVAASGVREKTGCTIVAVRSTDGQVINPGPAVMLHEGSELVLVGGVEAEAKFREAYGK
ncbi:MAG: potassium channel protein [Phycisphaeraceae bacterium]|nr:potassium channel protein [Phycisphaeraceae bacterium]